MATTVTLKIKCQDVVHRVPLQSHQVNYEAIAETIQGIYPGEVIAKYLDDEDDLCVLCAVTFSDFLNLGRSAGGKTILRLELFHAVPEGNFKGKGKCRGKGKDECNGEGKGNFNGKGKCKGKSRFAMGFEELFHSLGSVEGLMQQAAECSSPSGELATICALGAHGGGHASGAMKLGRALWQLHSAGMTSARCIAAVIANSLDDLIALAVEQSDAIDMAASVKPEVTQQVMEVLFASAAGVEGLEDCAGKMEASLAGEPVSASEVLLGLLTAMSELTFSARVSFLEALCTSQQERIDGLFDMARPFMAMLPPVPADHHHVICDGCDQAPLRGPRFKCTSCADCDLCARCFADKDSACGGKCDGHEFETITTRKGKGKGKGKWKDKHDAAQTGTDAQCKRETECKGRRCASKGSECQEPLRGKLSTPDIGNFIENPPAPDVAVAVDDKASSPHFDVSFPVVVGDGHRVNLYWNIGDDPQQVAEAFVAQHGVLPEVLPTVLRFVEQCMADGAQQPKCEESPAAPDGAAAEDDKTSSLHFDVSFPVDVGDGHRVNLFWNIGDDPQQVAEAFVAQHGVLPEELPTVLRFVEQCMDDGTQQPK